MDKMYILSKSYELGNWKYENDPKARQEIIEINNYIYKYLEESNNKKKKKLLYRLLGIHSISSERYNNEWRVKLDWGNISVFYSRYKFIAYIKAIISLI